MKVLITGGLGFIGTNLIARLQATRPEIAVRILDSEVLGKRAHLDAFDGEVIIGDIRDATCLAAALDGVDQVVHLAADTRVIESIADPALNFSVNAEGTFLLLDAMRRGRVNRIINASTGGAIIGDATPPVHEGMLPQPLSPYGASKLAAEGYCSAFAGSYGIDALSLRFANVYGPRSFHKGSVVAAFFKQVLAGGAVTIYGDGSQTRDYVNVADICDGIIAGLDAAVSGVLQLGSGRPCSINQLVDAIRAVVAPLEIEIRHSPARRGEILHTYCDVRKASAVLGFQPRVDLSEGLREAWDWFRSWAARK